MTNIYTLLRYFSHLGGSRMKMAALWLLHITHRRYIGVFIDPILACNYRCRMCYMSNEEERNKQRSGRLTNEQLEAIAQSIFHRTIKLQIGCAAEPTMDMKGALRLVELGKQYGVPYIALTSNGALMSYDKLYELVEAGLDELTVSLHGIHRETYTNMMGPTSDYEAFLTLLQSIRKIKTQFPKFDIRINYTMNADNVDELVDFDTLFADVPINQLQLRPIRRIGESDYQNFDLTHVSECLETVIRPLADRCRQKGITVLFPEQINIARFEGKEQASPRDNLIPLFTYYNITPKSYRYQSVHYEQESYEEYSRREHIAQRLFRGIWMSEKACQEEEQSFSNSLNYDIR